MTDNEENKMETDAGQPPPEQPRGQKRRMPSFQNVDIDTGADLPNPKRRNIILNEDIKVKSLKVLINAYGNFIAHISEGDKAKVEELSKNLNVSTQITSIIMTLHNINRQRVNVPGRTPEAERKAKLRSFQVNFGGGEFPITFDVAMTMWTDAVKTQSLEYKRFDEGSADNWIGTISPYLTYASGFQLRMKELRMGHGRIITGKDKDGNPKGTAVSTLGLNGAHHVLLEGISWNPEKKTSMAQSLGLMTTFIQMLRTDEIRFRKKWEEAVKAQMGSISCIDDIIMITRHAKRLSDFAPLTTLLAEILLISTGRQIKRMFLPLAMLRFAVDQFKGDAKKQDEFLKMFNVSSHGGYYCYSLCCKQKWTINGSMEDSQASQMVFHSIFGTYSEDLGILEQITNVKRWYTREELGPAFKQNASLGTHREFSLPVFSKYSKLTSANQNTSLAGVYEQVTYNPTFAGYRMHKFSDDFINHIQKQTIRQTSGKSIAQLETSLSETLMTLRTLAIEGKLDSQWGTVNWFNMATVDTNSSSSLQGVDLDFKPIVRNKFFLAKAPK